MYVNVAELRRFLNLPFQDDDLLLGNLIDTAELSIQHRLNRTLESLENQAGDIPQDLKTCILTLAATIYNNREAVSYGTPYKVPFSVEFLLQPYINYNRD